jgi:hypothetical protein
MMHVGKQERRNVSTIHRLFLLRVCSAIHRLFYRAIETRCTGKRDSSLCRFLLERIEILDQEHFIAFLAVDDLIHQASGEKHTEPARAQSFCVSVGQVAKGVVGWIGDRGVVDGAEVTARPSLVAGGAWQDGQDKQEDSPSPCGRGS